MLQSNLRQQGYRAREDDVRNALKLQDPTGTKTRKPEAKRKRRLEYIVPGPNFLWSIDGHDKLANYGIEIYAAIDACEFYGSTSVTVTACNSALYDNPLMRFSTTTSALTIYDQAEVQKPP
jgi:hypothetical protein